MIGLNASCERLSRCLYRTLNTAVNLQCDDFSREMLNRVTPRTQKVSIRGEIREKGSDDKNIKYYQEEVISLLQNKEVSLSSFTVFVDALVHCTTFNFLKVR